MEKKEKSFNANQERIDFWLWVKIVGPTIIVCFIFTLASVIYGQTQDNVMVVSRYDVYGPNTTFNIDPFVSVEDNGLSGLDFKFPGSQPFIFEDLNVVLFSKIVHRLNNPSNSSEIAIIDLETLKATELGLNPNIDFRQVFPAVSPDWNYISYVTAHGFWILPTYSTNKSEPSLLNTGSLKLSNTLFSIDTTPFNIRPYDWHPDGSKIIFTNEEAFSDPTLIELYVDGSAPIQIALPPDPKEGSALWSGISYSPSGQKIAIAHEVTFDNTINEEYIKEVVILNEDGTLFQRIDLKPQFSNHTFTREIVWLDEDTIAIGYNSNKNDVDTKSFIETEEYLTIDLTTHDTAVISLAEFSKIHRDDL